MKLADLWIRLGLKKDGFDKGITDAKQKTSLFGSAVGKIGGLIAGAFAASKIVDFGKELFNIAQRAEGIENAFNRVASATDLANLRKSVRGTVSDLNLMTRAVSASNFGIPVQELGNLLEFAAKRAQDTGQSVDYLVDSIVTGIGRKSPLILDNLGISAAQLTEELNGASVASASIGEVTAAVGRIASKSLEQTGRFADSLGTRVDSLGAKWDNLKVSISGALSSSTSLGRGIGDVLDDTSARLDILADKNTGFWTSIAAFFNVDWARALKIQSEALDETAQAQEKAKQEIEKTSVEIEKQVSMLQAATQASKDAQQALENFKNLSGRYAGEADAQSYIDKLTELQDAAQKAQQLVNSLARDVSKMQMISPIGDMTSLQIDLSESIGSPQLYDTSQLEGLDDFVNSINEKYSKILDDSTQARIKANYDKLNEINDSFNQAITQGIADVTTEMATALGESLATGDWSNFGNSLLGAVGSFMQQLGGLAITIGTALIAIDAGLATLNPFAVIGAGVALVAAGAAFSAFAKGGVKGSATASASSYSGSSYSGYSNTSGSMALTGDVEFVLEGSKLKGAIDNSNRRSSLIG